jgi:hypothetical protein
VAPNWEGTSMTFKSARSAVALAVAITAPVTAAVTVGVNALARRSRARVRHLEFGIHRVPERPRLWRTGTTGPIPWAGQLESVSAVPPENPHAPPTPPTGIAVRMRAR